MDERAQDQGPAPAIGERGALPRPKRIMSLDVSRGVLLVITIVVNAWVGTRPEALVHATWFGVTPVDLVFPVFVTLSGMGLAFAHRRAVPAAVTIRRACVLLLAGLLYNALMTGNFDPGTWRLTGTLQVYAVLVVLTALLHGVLRTTMAWAIFTLAWSAALAVGLFLWAGGCDAGALTPECNPSALVDSFLFGQHMYAGGARGHDPEGILSIAGMLATMTAGVTAGRIVCARHRFGGPGTVARILAWIGVLAGFAALCGMLVAPMKRLWTPGFALGAAACGILLFALCYVILDLRPSRNAAADIALRPLSALGRNSLLVYFGVHLSTAYLARTRVSGSTESWAEWIGNAVGLFDSPVLGFIIVNLLFWTVLALILNRYRIYVRA